MIGGPLTGWDTGLLVIAGLSLCTLIIALDPPRAVPPQEASSREAPLQEAPPHDPAAPVAPPKKIMVYAPVLEALATLDEGAGRVQAAPTFLRDMALRHPLSRIYPALADITPIGSAVVPDPEEVMRLDPDAVVVPEIRKAPLEQIGYPRVVALAPANGSGSAAARAELDAAWTALGDLLGKGARARALLAAYHRQEARLAPPAEAAGRPAPRVMVLIPISGAWRIGGRHLYLNPFLQALGAQNVAADLPLNSSADIEQVLALDPQVILILDGAGALTPADLFDDPRWQAVRAIQDRRVYVMPERATFDAPSDDAPFARWLLDVLYPRGDLEASRTAYLSAYQRLYGRTLNADDLRFALRDDVNSASAGYGAPHAP